MLKVKRFVCNPLQENTYVVSDETLDCVIIDCGAFSETEAKAIVGYIEENQLKPRHLICTHGHFDHVMGNGFMYEMLGLKPEYSELEQPLIGHVPPFIAPFLGTVSPDSVPPAQCYLDKDSIITFGSHRFEVQQTPAIRLVHSFSIVKRRKWLSAAIRFSA